MARRTIAIVTCLLLAAVNADARSVAVNFMAESWDGGPFPLSPTETAGVFPQQRWNNADVIDSSTDSGDTADILSPQPGILVDDVGAATGMTMTWHADTEAGSDGDSATSDERLMKGFLEGYGRFSTTGYSVRVEVSNVPYDEYKVVPYLIGFGFDTTASVRLNGEQYFYLQSSNFTTDGYIQATATSLANAQLATYAVFEDQTADSFTLDIVTETGNRGALAGLQIISTSPELTGDYNLDAVVDAADYVVWSKNVGNLVPQCSLGDANCNGFVENSENQPWKENFGALLQAGSGSASSSSVPEPLPLALLLSIVSSALSIRSRQSGSSRAERVWTHENCRRPW